MIDRFYTREAGHSPLSNFSAHPVTLGGLEWPTTEHYYQAMKTLEPDERERIRQAEKPREAKQLGREVFLRPDWEAVKIPVMRQALRAKFAVETAPGSFLLRTGDHMLVEGNDWGDTFWGADGGKGQNWLGHLLMARRAELRHESGL